MTTNYPRRPQDGFTIIEVLIVLAIAGLIALLVFQAIPTLTRNSRNNERKNGVASILRAVSHYELNNSGSLPTDCGGSGPAPSCFSSPFLQYDKLTYYDGLDGATSIVVTGTTPASLLSHSAITNTETVEIYNYQRCDPSTIGAGTSSAAGYNDIAALYAVEGSSGAVSQCQQL
jgi:prepilin-type N-terminal cleavage/methylation domain-containing protein